MNNDNNNFCPMPNCPDPYGTLPSCAGLAVPYVPFQQNNPKRYSKTEALSNGTLFPSLNLPFHKMVEGSSLPDTALSQLQALEFVLLELGTYLDTHSDDTEAFTLFQQMSEMERNARANYEKQFGPLTRRAAAADSRYTWLNDPWPWNYQQNEVK